MHFAIIILAFAGLLAAQSTTSLFIPGADTQSLIASIIGSDTLATTYAVECAPGYNASDCGFMGRFTLTEGPSTVAYTLSMGVENGTSSVLAFTGYFDCTLTGTTAGVCTESHGGAEAYDSGMGTTTLGATDIVFMPVTLTDSLPPNTDLGPAATSGSGSSTGSSGIAPSTTTSGSTAKSTTTGSSASTTGTVTSAGTSSSTGAAALAMVTGKAQWVVGGAAVAMAFL